MTPVEEREIIFLKGCLTNPMLYSVGATLVTEDALSVTGCVIYKSIITLRESGSEDSISPESLAYILNERGLLQSVGGLITLTAIKDIGFVCDVDGFTRICEDIKVDGRKKKIKDVLLDLASTEVFDPDELISDIVRRIYEVTENTITDGVIRADEAGRTSKPRFAFASSGLASLDRIIGGLVKNEYNIIAARASTGKTALGTQIGVLSALQDHPTIIFSLEQSKDALMGRIHRLVSQEDLADVPLYLMCQSGLTIGRIMAIVQMMKIMHGIQVVVIDYVGLIGGRRNGQSKNDFLDVVSKGIQKMSHNMDVTVMALVQLNRDSEREDREPALYDLRDSGDLEQDADNVILIHRRDRDAEMTKIICAKVREGRIGSFMVKFNQETVSFEE